MKGNVDLTDAFTRVNRSVLLRRKFLMVSCQKSVMRVIF